MVDHVQAPVSGRERARKDVGEGSTPCRRSRIGRVARARRGIIRRRGRVAVGRRADIDCSRGCGPRAALIGGCGGIGVGDPERDIGQGLVAVARIAQELELAAIRRHEE